jgi:hypothetical protein
MLKNNFLFIFIAITFVACNSGKTKTVSGKKVRVITPDTITNKVVPKTTAQIDTSITQLKITCKHAFSDEFKLDTFKLALKGPAINNGIVTFDIVAFDGRKIYTETFDSTDLLGDLDDLSNKQKTDTITARFKDFFNENAFTSPALRVTDSLDTDYVALNIQKDILSDKTAIGFFYAIGYESVAEIAYSKKNRKTVVCFASD